MIALVQRGKDLTVHTAGVAERGAEAPPSEDGHVKIASVAKAFSGAVALSLVEDGVLDLDDPIGKWRPDLPAAWHAVTLRQRLAHTGGVPDFLAVPAALEAISASPDVAPPPRELLDFVADEDLGFPPGSRYAYSNSDNIVVGLIVDAATGGSYEEALQELVWQPLGLGQTTLPRGPDVPGPFVHGYQYEPESGEYADVSEVLAGGWAWASGGMVSTPAELNRFVRGYVGGELFDAGVQAQQRDVRAGSSEPIGPGENAAGLALFRYRTSCGVVFGHTGNTLGYTQFIAASPDGSRSVTVSMTVRRTPGDDGPAGEVFAALCAAEELAVCAALAED